MLSYPYLLKAFEAILAHSKAIQGRVYWAPFFGSELNSENLEQIVADTLYGDKPKKYPLCIIVPPVSLSDIANSGRWDEYPLHQVWLKQDERNGDGSTMNPSPTTGRSMHTITDDWHDMRRVAQAFFQLFREVTMGNGMAEYIRISERSRVRYAPITRIGNEKLNGVLSSVTIQIFDACSTTTDYPSNVASLVIPPGLDPHPEHTM